MPCSFLLLFFFLVCFCSSSVVVVVVAYGSSILYDDIADNRRRVVVGVGSHAGNRFDLGRCLWTRARLATHSILRRSGPRDRTLSPLDAPRLARRPPARRIG